MRVTNSAQEGTCKRVARHQATGRWPRPASYRSTEILSLDRLRNAGVDVALRCERKPVGQVRQLACFAGLAAADACVVCLSDSSPVAVGIALLLLIVLRLRLVT